VRCVYRVVRAFARREVVGDAGHGLVFLDGTLLHVPALPVLLLQDARIVLIEEINRLSSVNLQQEIPSVVHVIGSDLAGG